ncbi:MAG TPA: hypothetical protein VE954_06965 [Oligoflexus sp.]|uniref:hypothetical protein n=1 Tax=Oligoflexus sp. TaxID=1971216 RepID=UPI002D4B65E9|nr:hypothetical protein [Oligoflexus sp.]HYX32837.1 hypothetical protein [Oligoflexus sp.]
MKIFKSIWLFLLFFASTVFAETPQLDLVLVAPGQRDEMRETVNGENVHGESSSLSFIASYYKDIASDNARIAAEARKAREEYEEVLNRTGVPPQPSLSASELESRDRAGQAIVDKTQHSLYLRREKTFSAPEREENERNRFQALKYYLSVANTTNQTIRHQFADMADRALNMINPDMHYEERRMFIDMASEMLDFAVGIGASVGVDTFQAITGKHYRTWQDLSETDHILSAASVMTLGFGGAGVRGVNAIVKIADHLYGPGHAVLVRSKVFQHVYDSARKFGFDLKSLKGGSTGDRVIAETLASAGNITSKLTLTSTEALDTGIKWVGDGYKQIGLPDSGVFRSADSLRQFRIDKGSIAGGHDPFVPHVHFETYSPSKRDFEANNHVPIKD